MIRWQSNGKNLRLPNISLKKIKLCGKSVNLMVRLQFFYIIFYNNVETRPTEMPPVDLSKVLTGKEKKFANYG